MKKLEEKNKFAIVIPTLMREIMMIVRIYKSRIDLEREYPILRNCCFENSMGKPFPVEFLHEEKRFKVLDYILNLPYQNAMN